MVSYASYHFESFPTTIIIIIILLLLLLLLLSDALVRKSEFVRSYQQLVSARKALEQCRHRYELCMYHFKEAVTQHTQVGSHLHQLKERFAEVQFVHRRPFPFLLTSHDDDDDDDDDGDDSNDDDDDDDGSNDDDDDDAADDEMILMMMMISQQALPTSLSCLFYSR
jgi:hypothetical protein